MTQFNPDNKETLTYGECLDPTSKITDQADADQYKAAYIAYQKMHMKGDRNDKGLTAEDIVNSNIGYWSGYYDSETAERIKRLFKCNHPIFL